MLRGKIIIYVNSIDILPDISIKSVMRSTTLKRVIFSIVVS